MSYMTDVSRKKQGLLDRDAFLDSIGTIHNESTFVDTIFLLGKGRRWTNGLQSIQPTFSILDPRIAIWARNCQKG